MASKPIFIYSDYCKFSQDFIKIIMKHPLLFDSIIRMNIDIQQNGKRPDSFYHIQQSLNTKITKVPTIITPNGEHILSDKNAFKWLETQIKIITPPEELIGFNSNEMNSFSDNYSTFGSTDLNDAKAQNYKFFDNKDTRLSNKEHKDNMILGDDCFLQTDQSWDPSEKNTHGFLNNLNDTKNTHNLDTKQSERLSFDNMNSVATTQRQNINFTNDNFKSGSQKQKDMDSKLEQMMADRKNVDNIMNSRPQY